MREKKQAGATIIEFALILVLFLTFLLGILDFARMLWTWNAANEATRWGARISVVCDRDATSVLASMKKFLPQLDAANVQIDWYDDKGISTTCGYNDCEGVNVQIVDLDYQWLSPFGTGIDKVTSMPKFSTYLPREIMGQDPNSASICNKS